MRTFKDGNQWCAVGDSFVNLQESPVGFGDGKEDAIENLVKDLEIELIQAREEGYVEGLSAYAWWKDGVQYVGACGQTLCVAIALRREFRRRMNEIECSHCGTICQVDGEMPRYFAWCETCRDYAGGFDCTAYAQEIMASIADGRPEEGGVR